MPGPPRFRTAPSAALLPSSSGDGGSDGIHGVAGTRKHPLPPAAAAAAACRRQALVHASAPHASPCQLAGALTFEMVSTVRRAGGFASLSTSLLSQQREQQQQQGRRLFSQVPLFDLAR